MKPNTAMRLLGAITGAFHGVLAKIDSRIGNIIHDEPASDVPYIGNRSSRTRIRNSERVTKHDGYYETYVRRDTGGPHSVPGARLQKLADEGRLTIRPRGCVSRAILQDQAARNRRAAMN